MCVIIIKDYDQDMPSKNILQACFSSNPDGAGFITFSKGDKMATIKKGYMDFTSFYDALKDIPKNQYAALHFRIGTSGGNTPQNCHPFPITNSVKNLKALEISTNKIFLHNGILGQGTKNLSDTQIFIKDILYTYADFLQDKEVQEIIAYDTIGSRTLSICLDTDTFLYTGEWQEHEGYKVSNKSFLSYLNRNGIYSNYVDYCNYFDMQEREICYICNIGTVEKIGINSNIFECINCATIYNSQGDILQDGDFLDDIPPSKNYKELLTS